MKKKIIITISLIITAIIVYAIVYFTDVYKIIRNESSIFAEWIYCNTTEELVDNVDFIYEGTVIGYHYEVIDYRNGQKFEKRSEEDDGYGELCTVYEIEVKEKYKGELPTKTTIKLVGGLKGEDELQQGILLKNAGLDKRDVRVKDIDVGETYLFTTCYGAAKNQIIINPEQYKYNQNNSYGTEEVNYDTIKKYVTSLEYTNPKEVPTEYIALGSKLLHTPEEIVKVSDKIFEGIVRDISFRIENSQLITEYRIYVEKRYKGEGWSTEYILAESGTDDYEVKEQYRLLNRNKITKRRVYEGLTTLKRGKTYIFAMGNGENIYISKMLNPAQFAFCSDNSNAPGGVDYKMMKEYLEK